MDRLVNALGFQAGWWACIAGVAHGRELAALAFCGALALAHIGFSRQPWAEVRLAAVALAVGIPLDTLLQQSSVIAFQGLALAPLSPAWLWMLWVLFALTLNSSLAFLKAQRWVWSAGLGLVFGPASYLAGARLGAASFEATPANLAVLAGAWMLVLPALVRLAAAGSPLTPTRSWQAAWSSRRR